MGGTTTHGWPYVTPDDHPKQFPAHSQALANKLEAAPVTAAGLVVGIPVIASGASTTVNVTFPVGRFTAVPVVVCSANSGRVTTSVVSVTTAGATLGLNNWSTGSTPAGVQLHWHASST